MPVYSNVDVNDTDAEAFFDELKKFLAYMEMASQGWNELALNITTLKEHHQNWTDTVNNTREQNKIENTTFNWDNITLIVGQDLLNLV